MGVEKKFTKLTKIFSIAIKSILEIFLKFIGKVFQNRRFIYLFAHVPHMFLGVALVLIFSRLVPKEDFGVFSKSFAFINIAGAFLYGWLQISLLRLANGVEGKESPFLKTLINAALLPIPLLFVISFFFAGIGFIEYPAVTALATVGYSLSISFSQYARGLNRAWLYGLIGASRMVVVLLFSFIAVEHIPDSRALILALAAGGFVSIAVGFVFLLEKRTSQPREVKDKEAISLKDLLVYGAPASLSLLSVMLLIHADRFVASYFITPGDLGLYSAQVDLARQLVYPIVSAIGVSLLPTAIRLDKDQGAEAAKNYVFKESSFLLLLVTPLAMLTIFYPGEIYGLLLPTEYAIPVGWAGSITAFSALLTGLRLLRFDPIFQITMEKEKIFYSATCGLVAWILLAWPLAHLFGVNGLASLGLVAAIVSCSVSFYLTKGGVRIYNILSFPASAALAICFVIILVDKGVSSFLNLGSIPHLLLVGSLMLVAVLVVLKLNPQRHHA